MESSFLVSSHSPLRAARPIASAAAVIAISGVVLLASFASAASAAESCASLRSEISDSGSHLYRYKDPKHPDLDLYRKYVKFDTQCSAGRALVTRYVPELVDCQLPTCTAVYGESPN